MFVNISPNFSFIGMEIAGNINYVQKEYLLMFVLPLGYIYVCIYIYDIEKALLEHIGKSGLALFHERSTVSAHLTSSPRGDCFQIIQFNLSSIP